MSSIGHTVTATLTGIMTEVSSNGTYTLTLNDDVCHTVLTGAARTTFDGGDALTFTLFPA